MPSCARTDVLRSLAPVIRQSALSVSAPSCFRQGRAVPYPPARSPAAQGWLAPCCWEAGQAHCPAERRAPSASAFGLAARSCVHFPQPTLPICHAAPACGLSLRTAAAQPPNSSAQRFPTRPPCGFRCFPASPTPHCLPRSSRLFRLPWLSPPLRSNQPAHIRRYTVHQEGQECCLAWAQPIPAFCAVCILSHLCALSGRCCTPAPQPCG